MGGGILIGKDCLAECGYEVNLLVYREDTIGIRELPS